MSNDWFYSVIFISLGIVLSTGIYLDYKYKMKKLELIAEGKINPAIMETK